MSGPPTTGCETCRYCTREDVGYSNWTVEGARVDCLKGLNPSFPLDDDVESKAFNAALAFGETCPARVAGDGPYFDVEGEVTDEEACGGDAELLALVKAWKSR